MIKYNNIEKLKGFKPLCYISERLILFKKGKVYAFDNNELKCVLKLDSSMKDKIKQLNRLTVRLFRQEPRCAIAISDNEILMVYRRKIYCIDIFEHTFKVVSNIRDGFSDTLNLCLSKQKDYKAIWGDYGSNCEYEHINIYGLTSDNKVKILYAFKKNTIRHIHNIISCENGYFIFTGDNEAESGIYFSDFNFNKVIPILTGNGKTRAVQGFYYENKLIYATDFVESQNTINYIDFNDDLMQVTELGKINGSCIYGTELRNGFLFSTTVESSENTKGLKGILSTKPAGGIHSKEIQLIYIDKDSFKLKLIKQNLKDNYPMKLFQYGCFMFPKNAEQRENVAIYCMAQKKFDGKIINIKEGDYE